MFIRGGDIDLVGRRVEPSKSTEKVSKQSRVYIRNWRFITGAPITCFDPGL